MLEPTPRSSRLAILGGLAAAISVGAAGFLLGRESSSLPTPDTSAAPALQAPAPLPRPTDVAPSVLRRADLLALAERAADAFASGQATPDAVNAAAGRQFDLVLPFGCSGPSDPATTGLGWQYDAAKQTLRVSATPVTWSGADWPVGEDADASTSTGFWVSRPWSSSERCPERPGEAASTGTSPVTLPGQTLAIATFGTENALAREGRAFETVQPMPEFDGSQGFRLRITGRLDRAASRTPIRCVQPAGIEQRPICAIVAIIDEVRIEDPSTDATLATWPIGRRS